MGVTEIVRFLIKSGVPFPIRNRKWTGSNVTWMLRNPKYVGMNVWGRTSSPLQGKRIYEVPRSAWVVNDAAFEPIVDRVTFDKVQRIFGRRRSKNYWYSDEQLLWKLKHLRRRKGKVTTDMIDGTPGPTASTYTRRFGNLLRSYELAGCKPSAVNLRRTARWRRSDKLRQVVMKRIGEALHEKVQFGESLRRTLLIDNNVQLALVLCRTTTTPLVHRRWAFRIRRRDMGLVTLVCLCNERLDAVKHIYLYGNIEKCRAYKTEFRIKEDDPFLRLGIKLKDFGELYPALERLLLRKEGCSGGETARTPIAERRIIRPVPRTTPEKVSQSGYRHQGKAG
jgi:hypothetical protein